MKKSEASIRKIVKFAKDKAELHGHRWTETREQVFITLVEMDAPATAYQLLDEVSRRYNRPVKPASIYRSLTALMTLGVVARIETANAFVVCKHPDHDHQHVFLVCDHCGRIDEIADHGISRQLQKGAESQGFKPSRQVLELHGDCMSCQK